MIDCLVDWRFAEAVACLLTRYTRPDNLSKRQEVAARQQFCLELVKNQQGMMASIS